MTRIPQHLQTRGNLDIVLHMPALKATGCLTSDHTSLALSAQGQGQELRIGLTAQDHRQTCVHVVMDPDTATQLKEQLAALSPALSESADPSTPKQGFRDTLDGLMDDYANARIGKTDLMEQTAETIHHFATEHLDTWKDDHVNH